MKTALMGIGASSLLFLGSSGWGLIGLWPLDHGFGEDPLQTLRSYYDQGNCRQMLQEATGLWLKRLSPRSQGRAYWYVGQCQERLGHLDKALSAYQVAVQLYPKDKDLLLALANLFRRVQLDDRARALYESLLSIDSDNLQAHLGLADSYSALGILEKALHHYERAVQISKARGVPQAPILLDCANVLYLMRKLDEAEAAARKALTLSSDPEIWLLLAKIQRRKGERDRSLKSLDQAQRLSPDRQDLWLLRALWLEADGRTGLSRQALRPVLKKDPQQPVAQWLVALEDIQSKDYPEAARILSSLSQRKQDPFLALFSSRLVEELQKTAGPIPGGAAR